MVKTEGDAFFAAFDAPVPGISAAVAAQRAIAAEAWADGRAPRVRMGVHLGEGRLRAGPGAESEDYVGIDVNYTARIAAAGNGGQIVLSGALVAILPRELAGIDGFDGVVLVSDGLRSVKDFEDPAPLFRLVVPGAADDPRPLRTTEVPSNLPGDVTTLVGREDEIGRLRDDLRDSRIVTLTGPGGSGKTRLALAVARDVRDRFPHGVWFNDLAAVRDPSLIEPAVAATLDVRESPDRTVEDALRAHLRDRTALLLLDNLEQLLPVGAEIVARIVRDAPSVRLLATSRELLRIAGEQGRLGPTPGARCGDRALCRPRSRAETGPRPHGGCPRLDPGDLRAPRRSAARDRAGRGEDPPMSPALIRERLGRSLDLGGGARDVPERQRTLRGAVAWSYDLLSPAEARLFSRLAVFASGWTAEAALAVADPDGDLGVDVLNGLDSLADKSLLRIEPGGFDDVAGEVETRFSIHPLLREYGLERLQERDERQRDRGPVRRRVRRDRQIGRSIDPRTGR